MYGDLRPLQEMFDYSLHQSYVVLCVMSFTSINSKTESLGHGEQFEVAPA